MPKHERLASAFSPQKKTSIVAINEDDYSLSFKILKSQWEAIGRKEQREIKHALRDLDDKIYTLLEASRTDGKANPEAR